MSAMPMHEFALIISHFATGALAAALWQGVLLAGAAAIGLRLLPETPARVRFAIWFAVFALIVGLPFTGLWVRHNGAAAATATSSHTWVTMNDRWCFWIVGIWAAASLIRAISLVFAAYRVRALWKRARPVPSSRTDLDAAGRRLELCISDEVDRPTVIGFFSPRIVLPEWLLERLTPVELDQVVLHEASHLSRRDDWLNLVQKLALVLFPLNPALAWIERRLCVERELACDESVLRATGAPIAYAECLARIAEYRLERRSLVRGLALALGAIGRESELARRVLSLLSRRKGMKSAHARLVFGGAMVMLVSAAAALERTPQLVGFSSTVVHAPAQRVIEARALPLTPGFRAVAVRATAVPAQEWKTIGDAPSRPAVKKPVRGVNAVKAVARPQFALAGDLTAQNVSSQYDSDAEANEPSMVQTVATTREFTPDGDVVVTRWVTVSPRNSVSSVADSAHAMRFRGVQAGVPFAAFPVQGGWFVFQL
jgi:beta-lactamase regulating signal transducer with metallopeptidase domain